MEPLVLLAAAEQADTHLLYSNIQATASRMTNIIVLSFREFVVYLKAE